MDHDLGLLLLRLALGPMLVAHGWNKAFGPGGLTGTTSWFASLGLQPAWMHARLAAGTEIAAGVMLSLGAATPAACTAFVGLMLVATLTDHRGKGYFVFKGGSEYTILVAAVAVAIAALGPGAWSIDHLLGLDDMAGAEWALGVTALGTAMAMILLMMSRRPAESTAEG